jgi:acyl-homoserine lactone acylase PvdQ
MKIAYRVIQVVILLMALLAAGVGVGIYLQQLKPRYFGPTMRFLVDFADIENSLEINPTGQSGYFLSSHYNDQAELFNSGQFRRPLINQTSFF